MDYTYPYSWIIPLIPLPIPMLLGVGLIVFPMATKNLRRMWAFPSIFLLNGVMLFSVYLSIQQINQNSLYQYVWSWTITNDFSLDFGYLIDSLASIMVILISTVGILVLFYSDNYMYHDQGYLRFFSYLSFFTTSMLGLVTSVNLIQIYIFWELVGMCSYLLIGFWFTRPIASNACQKAFVTNRIGDFGLLLGILGLYAITGSFEFRDLFEILNKLVYNNEVNFLFLTLCALFLFTGAVAKSSQFPLHVWLPDAMEGPTPISALIHAATMVAAGIFLVARLLPLFIIIPHIMNFISLIGIVTLLFGATLSLAQKDIKRSLAYSTMSQLGYMMLALGMGSYRAALFHLITHAYSKALLFLGSGSIIHSMEAIVGYSPEKSQNMVLMGGLKKHVPITKTAFLIGTLSLCGIPPLACFWSKDEILNDSWLYLPVFSILAYFTAGVTAFYMFRIYLLTFEGHLNVHFKNYSGQKSGSCYSISPWGKEIQKNKVSLLFSSNSNEKGILFFFNTTYPGFDNRKKTIRPFLSIPFLGIQNTFFYPPESDSTMLFPMSILVLFTCLVGIIGIPYNQSGIEFDLLSNLLKPSINLLHPNPTNSMDWYEFFRNSIFSVSLAFFGIFIAFFLYKPIYSSFKNLNLQNSFVKGGNNNIALWEKIINLIYDWSYNRGYIDFVYQKYLTGGLRRFAELTHFCDRRGIDGIPNAFGLLSFFGGEVIKYLGAGRISSYLLFYLGFVLVFIFLLFYLFLLVF
uniref:NAD(P)H-quinone oxidoreductase subunit 5, chloroplastic n=2 Tax=Heterotis rotundifolia TaxID=40000 RepID=A0A7L7YXL3_HETRU|nr:NADH-plastoquinone oxidoreductase subunit 5 [Heterotis rotundifolia]QOD41766.1 NADH-plastoquinone oxidoreductase subunit 5 [Heterotis rotundifolia]